MRTPNTVCFTCSKPCYAKPHVLGVGRNFCSWDCFLEQRRLDLIACAHCEKPFKRRLQSQRFCSKTCSNRGRAGIRYDGTRSQSKSAKVQRYRKIVLERGDDQCSECGLGSEWNGKPLLLQVDHIDGDRSNDSPSNLRLLCPNCHSQTPTYGHRNFRRSGASLAAVQ